jgi:hypothetical protein
VPATPYTHRRRSSPKSMPTIMRCSAQSAHPCPPKLVRSLICFAGTAAVGAVWPTLCRSLPCRCFALLRLLMVLDIGMFGFPRLTSPMALASVAGMHPHERIVPVRCGVCMRHWFTKVVYTNCAQENVLQPSRVRRGDASEKLQYRSKFYACPGLSCS